MSVLTAPEFMATEFPPEAALYRFFDGAGDLLYVGISVRPWERFKQHRGDKQWWHEVANITIEPHGTKAEARTAEKAAIKSENPRYNIADKPRVTADVICEGDDEPWDQIHRPEIACVGDLLTCGCSPIDYHTEPDRRVEFVITKDGWKQFSGPVGIDPLDPSIEWRDKNGWRTADNPAWRDWFLRQPYFTPANYSLHVMEAVVDYGSWTVEAHREAARIEAHR